MIRDFLIGILIGIVVLFIVKTFAVEPIRPHKTEEIAIDTVVPEIVKRYGIPVDSFLVEEGKIKPNESLSKLLNSHDVPYAKIYQLVENSKDIYDLRKIRRGKKYSLFFTDDTLQELKYFVYEPDASEYVKLSLGDSLHVDYKMKEINTFLRTGSGTIESSLWNAMVDNNLDPVLANKLSDIYAWTIDFFGLQKGDKFKFLYEENWTAELDSQKVGFGKIITSSFFHANQEFYAIPFVQDSNETYFDTLGQSLEKAYLKAPLKFSRISSRFTYSRFHPIFKVYRPHLGVDYAAPIGTPVHALGDGVVIKAAWSGGAGRMVKIRHNSNHTTGYLHLSKFGKGVKNGAFVRQGQVIGYVGSSGHSTGPHLDFRFWKNGKAIDPTKIKAPPCKPVDESDLDSFYMVRDKYLELLNNIKFPLPDSTLLSKK